MSVSIFPTAVVHFSWTSLKFNSLKFEIFIPQGVRIFETTAVLSLLQQCWMVKIINQHQKSDVIAAQNNSY